MSEAEASSGSPHDRFIVRASGSPDWPVIWLPRPQRRVERRNLPRALRLLGALVPDYPASALVGAWTSLEPLTATPSRFPSAILP